MYLTRRDLWTLRNGRRAFQNKIFSPIWAVAEWIFGNLAKGGEHFLLPYSFSHSISDEPFYPPFSLAHTRAHYREFSKIAVIAVTQAS